MANTVSITNLQCFSLSYSLTDGTSINLGALGTGAETRVVAESLISAELADAIKAGHLKKEVNPVTPSAVRAKTFRKKPAAPVIEEPDEEEDIDVEDTK